MRRWRRRYTRRGLRTILKTKHERAVEGVVVTLRAARIPRDGHGGGGRAPPRRRSGGRTEAVVAEDVRWLRDLRVQLTRNTVPLVKVWAFTVNMRASATVCCIFRARRKKVGCYIWARRRSYGTLRRPYRVNSHGRTTISVALSSPEMFRTTS